MMHTDLAGLGSALHRARGLDLEGHDRRDIRATARRRHRQHADATERAVAAITGRGSR